MRKKAFSEEEIFTTLEEQLRFAYQSFSALQPFQQMAKFSQNQRLDKAVYLVHPDMLQREDENGELKSLSRREWRQLHEWVEQEQKKNPSFELEVLSLGKRFCQIWEKELRKSKVEIPSSSIKCRERKIESLQKEWNDFLTGNLQVSPNAEEEL